MNTKTQPAPGAVLALFSAFFFQAADGIRDRNVTGVQTCALPILMESSSGVGSTLSFTIPLATTSTPVKATEEVAATSYEPIRNNLLLETALFPINDKTEKLLITLSENATILVVVNDVVNLEVIVNVLTPYYKVKTARSGEEALKVIDKEILDVVITDVILPGISGYALTDEIRKQYSRTNLAVLLLTNDNHPGDVYSGFVAGANDYITKPAKSYDLLVRVGALAAIRRSVATMLQTENAWLQAQIQPHFLFNTLNTIASLGEFDIPRMKYLLKEFGNFLQRSYAYSNRDSLINLEEELALIDSYVSIQEVRFGERVSVQWDIDEI